MPVSTQVVQVENGSPHFFDLEDIRDQNVYLHSLRFEEHTEDSFKVHIWDTDDKNEVWTIDYSIFSSTIRRMGCASNWLQMFPLPMVFLGGTNYISFAINGYFTGEVTCTYTWTPCDNIPYIGIYQLMFISGKDYICHEPLQDEWLKESYPIVRHTPWWWTIDSEDYPFTDQIPRYIFLNHLINFKKDDPDEVTP